jgi:hypothetical protein
VNTTRITRTGLYTVTVVGAHNSSSSSATATVAVTSVPVPQNSTFLYYKAKVINVAYPGKSVELNNSFSNLGYVGVGIEDVTVKMSFGSFHPLNPWCPDPNLNRCDSNPPPMLSINPFEEKSMSLWVQIPNSTNPGEYSMAVTIKWELYSPPSPSNGGSLQQPQPDLTVPGHLTVENLPQSSGPSAQNLNKTNQHTSSLFTFPMTVIIAVLAGTGPAIVLFFGIIHPRIMRSRSSENKARPAVLSSCDFCGASIPLSTD